MAIWIPLSAPTSSSVVITALGVPRCPLKGSRVVFRCHRSARPISAGGYSGNVPAPNVTVRARYNAFQCIRLNRLLPYASVAVRLGLLVAQFRPAIAFQSAGGYFFGSL